VVSTVQLHLNVWVRVCIDANEKCELLCGGGKRRSEYESLQNLAADRVLLALGCSDNSYEANWSLKTPMHLATQSDPVYLSTSKCW
jgi:hypothetical protein